MNYSQMGLFVVYALSVFFSGVGIYSILDRNNNTVMNRSIYLGEVLLLGGVFVVGELLILSLLGLYKSIFLWAVVLVNIFFLIDRRTRLNLKEIIRIKITFDLPLISFILLLFVFVYRNCYCMVDVDSLVSYLFTQKLWLIYGTSLVGDATYNSTLFAPQFDTLPSVLGLSIFSQETLFPQLINLFWRIIVLILVFGYTAYKFNRYYGLSAAIFVALNDHFFFSGVNRWVLINGAVVAFLFSAAYNFWEARQQNSAFRFTLALIFLSQMLANKIQIIFILIFFLITGMAIQRGLIKKIKAIILSKRFLLTILISLVFVSLWYLKDFLITGNPIFPVLAGKLGTFGFTPEQGKVFYKVASGIRPSLFVKYMNYLFIWPGINAAKIVIFTVSFLPFLLFLVYSRRKDERDRLLELFFWLGLCILAVLGTSLACHWEPRYHRYPIALMAFTAVVSLQFIFTAIGIKNKLIIGTIMLLVALKGGFNEGYRIVLDHDGFFMRPSIGENAEVLLNKIHTDDAVRKVCPEIDDIFSVLRDNNHKVGSAAWDIASFNYPLFLLPVRPLVSPWHTTTINWDSYKDTRMVIADLKKYGIDWIMQMRNGKLIFVPIEEYASGIVKFNKHPTTKYATYDLPPELSNIYW